MYHKRKLSLWPCYQAKIFLVCFMTSFGYHVLFFCIYFVCTCFFVDKYLRDVVYLRNLYTWERIHILLIYGSPSFYLLWFFGGSGKNLAMSACLILLHLHALIFGLVTSFVFPLHLIELVNLLSIYAGSLFRVCWVDMLSTMSHIYWRLCWCSMLILVLVSPNAWPCHSHNFGWANSYVLSSLVAQPYVCCKCYALFPIYALLHIFGVLNDFGGVRMPCLCTLYSNAIILISARTLGSFPISFKHSFALLHMFML